MLRPIAPQAIAIAVAAVAAASVALGLWLWPSAEPFAKSVSSRLISAIAAQGETPPSAAPGAQLTATTVEAAGPVKETETILTKPEDQRPAFDIVRVEPTGEAVIAGHFSKNSAIELRVDGRVVAGANADSVGDFTILPPRLAAGAHRLELSARSEQMASVLSDAILIDVPAQPGERPLTPEPPSRNIAPAPETAPPTPGSAATPGSVAALSKPDVAPPAFNAEGARVYRPHAPASRLRLQFESVRAAEAKRDRDLLAIAPPSAQQSVAAAPHGGGHAAK